MKSLIYRQTLHTRYETELIDITPEVRRILAESGVQEGTLFVLSLHTTTGLTVNEGLPDLEADIANTLEKLVPDNAMYRHARYLPSDGQMAVNATSHLRGMVLGFEVYFPIEAGELVTGSRQTIYFVELDGPQSRNYVVQVFGC